ncbi:HlyD family efflux transporter periplasmic adaptor subunit [Candidatus Parcubacteria bacterium]|jgi:HlyD family secretion protein|nr:MAG: HlyD family efflux transporter periplasmic adaptor subunit [Candidatus Parcubacteria bacterium]
MKNEHTSHIFRRLLSYIKSHKFLSFIALVVLFVFLYWIFGGFSPATVETKYVTADVSRQTILVTVGGSGQVSATNEVDIKPKVSGDITWIGVRDGSEVKKGQALFSIDSTTIRKNIRDSELSLQQAEYSLEKNTAQAPIDYNKKIKSLADAKENLSDAYNDSFVTISNAFLNLPSVMTTAENVLFGTDLSPQGGQWNGDAYRDAFNNQDDKDTITFFSDIAKRDYKTARELYDSSIAKFKTLTTYSSPAEIERVLDETADTAIATAQALKSEKNLVDTVIDIAEQKQIRLNSYVSSAQSSLATKIGTVNTQVSALSAQVRTVENLKDTITDTEQEITIYRIKNESGNDPLTLQSERNSVQKMRDSLTDLKEELLDYTVYAPFDGVISSINFEKGDSINSGAAFGSLITKQRIAEISLNEIDAAKVKIGQKVSLSFDAISDLSISGKVFAIDAVGTVSQGVVTYSVQMEFDTQDERVKPGMSVSASIIVDMRQDVLAVPNGAVKTQGNSSYVQILNNIPSNVVATGFATQEVPQEKFVEVGISGDSYTEIVSGVSEGEHIITRTTSATPTAAKTTTAPSLFGGSGGTRIPR